MPHVLPHATSTAIFPSIDNLALGVFGKAVVSISLIAISYCLTQSGDKGSNLPFTIHCRFKFPNVVGKVAVAEQVAYPTGKIVVSAVIG